MPYFRFLQKGRICQQLGILHPPLVMQIRANDHFPTPLRKTYRPAM